VQTEYRTVNGLLAYRKYLGGGKRRLAYVDADGKERDRDKILLVQVLPGGTRKEIKPFKMTKTLKAKSVDREVMYEFLTHSYLEIGSYNTEGQRQLRRLA
jgi:hypothetical protein